MCPMRVYGPQPGGSLVETVKRRNSNVGESLCDSHQPLKSQFISNLLCCQLLLERSFFRMPDGPVFSKIREYVFVAAQSIAD